jgi:endonuclease/exonuclease/phosphatase family metal-dependent hydrolase
MDGGKMVQPDSKETVRADLDGIVKTVESASAQVVFVQEVDSDSHRSYGIDEVTTLEDAVGANGAFAYNFKSIFTPYPWPPIGKVNSGLLTLTTLKAEDPQRIALPVPFSWPVRMFNLKRGLLVERVPLTGGSELVLVNLHLEAYEDGSGRDAQMKELVKLLEDEYAKGNYVIAGGDFNQSFPGVKYPELDTTWVPGVLDASALGPDWTIAHDTSVPTSRLNNKPYSGNPDDTQLFGIDGYILSPNVSLGSVTTMDEGFEFADHNPVKARVTLIP